MKGYHPSIHIKKKNDINNNNNTFCLRLNNTDHIAYFRQNFFFHDLRERGNIYPVLKRLYKKVFHENQEHPQSSSHQSQCFGLNVSSFLDQCRILAFPSTLFFVGERLVNHTITNISVIDRDTCEYSCYLNHNCVSVNFYFGPSEAGIQNCELNNSTSKEHDKDLVKATNYVYHGTKVRRQCL